MATTEEPIKEWGGMGELELGLLIGGVGLALLIIIVLINVCICVCNRKKKGDKYIKDEEKMVNMQTERTLNGQNVTQVIVKTQPNGNMDKYNRNNHPYQTMDPETNTVRYETAQNQSMQQDTPLSPVIVEYRPPTPQPSPVQQREATPVPSEPEAVTNHSSTKVITTDLDEDDVDSGTGTSPTRAAAAAVDVHEQQTVVHDNSAFSHDDEEEVDPYASYSMPPPPPDSMPPPLTPGTPVTDLDADETILVPPPPPPQEDVYAQVNKRGSGEATVRRDDSMMRSVWRPSSEIEIIEKAKF